MPKPAAWQLAKTDQANAAADKFIDDVLTDMVSQIDQGVQHANITARIGSGIITLKLGEVEKLVVAARALARLARMHHAAERLADTWRESAAYASRKAEDQSGPLNADHLKGQAATLLLCAEAVRKLVDDHG